MSEFPNMVDGQPNLCGREDLVEPAASQTNDVYRGESDLDFQNVKSCWSIALHMQQPLIPAGGGDLSTAELISNLQYMMEHQGEGDNHNAPVFHWCYKRIGEFVPELVDQGKQPRVMLDYAGCLLHGFYKMGLTDVIDSLRRITCEPQYRKCAEWLGCTWSHAVAPSTPVEDYRLHVKAWQHHFASIFGTEALSRVRGFSPAEMALPNHPDVAYEFVKTLKDCGYTWVLVQEHTVESPETGHGPELRHLPHRLVARNSNGEEISIIAVIKTQGSDTKLVAQMQPFHEAKSLDRWELNGKPVPPLVTQIGDGENGGVMMNEFPDGFRNAMSESSHSPTRAVCVTEYLELLFASGIREEDLPVVIPSMQKKIWDRFDGKSGHEAMAKTIEEIKQEDGSFHMDGGSWTNDISWVQGYDNVLEPLDKASALFHEKTKGVAVTEARYRNALFYLLVAQTSCYRYWGQGTWTDYAREICRRLEAALQHDF